MVVRGTSAVRIHRKGVACRRNATTKATSKASLQPESNQEAAVNTAGAKVAAAPPDTYYDKLTRLAKAIVSCYLLLICHTHCALTRAVSFLSLVSSLSGSLQCHCFVTFMFRATHIDVK